jgi:uncharacterized protein (DUF2164 family)
MFGGHQTRLAMLIFMSIELTSEERRQAVASIECYFAEQLDQTIGNIAARGLLAFLRRNWSFCLQPGGG